MLKLIGNTTHHLQRTAIVDRGQVYTYNQLINQSAALATILLGKSSDLNEKRIAYMVRPSMDYSITQWAIWRAGGIAVPICISYPLPSLEYVIDDAGASTIICTPEFELILRPVAVARDIRLIVLDNYKTESAISLPEVARGRRALMLYTSGTTGKPKGVITTHANIEAQIKALIVAWEWKKEDHILNILPLHHVHGIINILNCAMWIGGCCEFIEKFSSEAVFDVFKQGDINLFMAVPTIYYKLIKYWNETSAAEQKDISTVLQSFRLMVSGSAALPISTLEKWKTISGHILLERYGMTEMGMAISNPYQGERRPGHIGQPLPDVVIRIADDSDQEVAIGSSGEIQVKGPNVFHEYWNRPEATKATFTNDGWFKTGDVAVYTKGYYKILGRNSIDIIKSGGYKISALEIEEILRKHPQISDCGVVGLPDEEWGEIIGASLILNKESQTNQNPIDIEELKIWLKERLPSYKLPRKYIVQDDLPRNIMGKVTKNKLKGLF